MHATPARRALKRLKKTDYVLFWMINGRLRNRFVDFPVRIVNAVDTALGAFSKLVILLLAAGLVSWQLKGREWKTYFLYATAVILVNAAAGVILKRVTRVRRPLYVLGNRVHIYGEKLYKYSMPSGHTQIAFCIATLLNRQLHGCGWLWYGAASLVGFYRVYVGAHFPSDVVAGAALGTGITSILLAWCAFP